MCKIQITCKRKPVINVKYATVCKQSLKALLVAFEIYSPIFFRLPVCKMSIGIIADECCYIQRSKSFFHHFFFTVYYMGIHGDIGGYKGLQKPFF